MLEMFAQHCDISNYFKAKGWKVDSIGLYGRSTIKKDVMEIMPGDLPYYDFVWSSPPCERFSRLSYLYKNRNEEKDKEAIALHAHGVEIVEQIDPELLIIENPVGKLREMSFMQKYYRYTINQSDYGLNHKKPTDLFSNSACLAFNRVSQNSYIPFEYSVKKFRSRYPSDLVEYVYNLVVKTLN